MHIGFGDKARRKDHLDVCGRIIMRWIIEEHDDVAYGRLWEDNSEMDHRGT
jgi:hypothetical protein